MLKIVPFWLKPSYAVLSKAHNGALVAYVTLSVAYEMLVRPMFAHSVTSTYQSLGKAGIPQPIH